MYNIFIIINIIIIIILYVYTMKALAEKEDISNVRFLLLLFCYFLGRNYAP